MIATLMRGLVEKDMQAVINTYDLKPYYYPTLFPLKQTYTLTWKALEAQDAYRGAMIRTYEEEIEVDMLRGGVLKRDVSKRLKVKAYLINEDLLVRSGEILD